MMTIVLTTISISFWLLLLYYSTLTISGVLYRSKKRQFVRLESYPSVAVLIPAHNEGIVIADTLHAMSKIEYPGDVQIYLLNDNSQDETGEIAQYYADSFPNIHYIQVPPGTPKGKSRVLNYGISISESEYIAVYDADNQPEPQALRLLVEAAETTPKAVGAVGYVKTINETKNALTRMIALEFSAFQLLMQSGRWGMFKLGSLTGTNLVIKRDALTQAGGYDPYALAEDADLTLTLTDLGGLLPIVPEARTWEQEPESFSIWLRQRTRWMQGNLYLIEKTLKNPRLFKGKNVIHSVQLLTVYILFVVFLLVSDLWFVLGLFGHVEGSSTVPLLILWFEAWLMYFVQLVTAQMSDKKITPIDLLFSFLMYFSYAQFWLFLFLRGIYCQIKLKRSKLEPVWDKTERFKQIT
ncbi:MULTISPECIES: glycosyltransferase [unclassified Paenibacillus]|uniref:glycosyltransferase family 2 protein n=1 Tax=unclassified Paenibacillus TaxID=185978 RepID=UPI0021192C89|nr:MULTISPECIES: glycosyltransferase [unclassified Paenibacillus]